MKTLVTLALFVLLLMGCGGGPTDQECADVYDDLTGNPPITQELIDKAEWFEENCIIYEDGLIGAR